MLGIREGSLEVAVAAPPVDGRANAELLRELSRFLGVPRRDVVLVGGKNGRLKRVAIAGISQARLVARCDA